MKETQYHIQQIDDPVESARSRAQDERVKQNGDWLQAHWPDLLPRARGKFIAVAGQEAFIADSPAEAWRRARAAHPEDNGVISQYVFPEGGPRIYGHRR